MSRRRKEMPMKTRGRPPGKRPVRKRKQQPARQRPQWLLLAGVAALVVLAVGFAMTAFGNRGRGPKASAGLPNTPDYHSLLVNPSNSQHLLLGTHVGLYVSADGGRHWRFD